LRAVLRQYFQNALASSVSFSDSNSHFAASPSSTFLPSTWNVRYFSAALT
jgi:hypothetical protein